MNMLRLVLISALVGLSVAGFCPPGQVPIGVNVTIAGPEIVCEKPSCHIDHDRVYSCSYYESRCKGESSWVSGIHSASKKLKMACCETPYLDHGRLIGQTTLHKGDSFTGGYFNDEMGKEGFDAIYDLQEKGSTYKVTVARVTCPTLQRKLIKPRGNDAIPGVAANLQIGPADGFSDNQVSAFDGPAAFDGPPIMDASFGAPPPGLSGPGLAGGLPGMGALAGLGAAGACFSEDTMVQTQTGAKTMKDLKVGDSVLSIEEGRFQYAPVTSFLHRYEEKQADFLDVVYGDRTLTLTPHHFIYTVPCQLTPNSKWEMKYAKDIVIGKDCLLRVHGDELVNMAAEMITIDSITPVVRKGVYGPLTTTGQIVVNDLIASCHAIVKDGTLLNSLLNLARNMESGIRQAKSWMGFSVDTNTLHEMPKSLEGLMHMVDGIFPENWKSMSQN